MSKKKSRQPLHVDTCDDLYCENDAHAQVERLNHIVADDLRDLTEVLVTKHNRDHVGGLLGGEWGYATDFSNDTFELHPFYWGDCTCAHDAADTEWWNTHEHADACYQQVIRARGFIDWDDQPDMDYHERSAHNLAITDSVCAEMGLDPENGSYVHCTCTHDSEYAAWRAANGHDETICAMDRPNFRHKPTGSTVSFYKYLGRGMKVTLQGLPWKQVYQDCLDSLNLMTP
jgi:hypothetical protein